MKAFAALIAAVGAVLVVPTGAIGASPDGAAGPWADGVVRFVQGPRVDGSPVTAGRSNALAALGPAEAARGNDDPIPEGTFVSLGFGGSLTLSFENPICNRAGADFSIDIREITREPYPAEAAAVYVSADGSTFVPAGTVSRDSAVAIPAELPIAWFVALVDVSDPVTFGLASNADGFDVDGVRALDMSSCVSAGTPDLLPPATTGPGDPLSTTTVPLTVKCSPAYWTSPLTLRVWPIGRTRQFNAVFGVKAFPRTTLLQAATRRGGGKVALAREAVYSLLTSLTPASRFRYSPAQVKRMVRLALLSGKARVVSTTLSQLLAARARGSCPSLRLG